MSPGDSNDSIYRRWPERPDGGFLFHELPKSDNLDLPTRPAKTSLAILNPTPYMVSAPRATCKQSTIKHVENLCRRVLELIQLRNWDSPDWILLDEDFHAYLPHSDEPFINSRAEYLQNYIDFSRANPSYRAEMASMLVDVNSRNGTASAWMHLRVTGHPCSLQRENVTVVSLRRQRHRWVAYRQTGMRGFGGFL